MNPPDEGKFGASASLDSSGTQTALFLCCLLNAVWICFVSERGSIIILPRLIVPASTCVWITDVVTDRRQQVRLEKIAASAGSPQGRLLCPPLVSVHLRRLVCSPPDVCSDTPSASPVTEEKRRGVSSESTTIN